MVCESEFEGHLLYNLSLKWGDGDVKMVAEKVEGQIVQKMSFKFRLANHSDEPLKPRIVSAKASTIL